MADLSDTETRLWQALASGAEVDVTDLPQEARRVRASVLAALLLGAHERPEPGGVAAVRLIGADIVGELQLGFSEVRYPLMLEKCSFDEEPDLYWARMDFVRMHACHLPGLKASHLQVARHLELSHSVFAGDVRMSGAHVAGGLLLNDARLHRLVAERLEVGADLVLARAMAAGSIRLHQSTVGGGVSIDHATITAPGERALDADMITVAGGFFGRNATITGEVSFRHSQIAGAIAFTGSTLSNPGGLALRADRLGAQGGLWMADGFRAEGTVRLFNAHVGRGLVLNRANLIAPGDVALVARGAVIEGGIQGVELHAEGTIDLRDASVTGPVHFMGATLSAPGAEALIASRITTTSDFSCTAGFGAEGQLRFSGASIGSNLSFDDSSLSAPGPAVLKCWRLKTPELSLRWRSAPEGLVDLRFAQAGVLRDDPRTWPKEVQLDGFSYDAIEPQVPAAQRLTFLQRDREGYRPQPYEQLAATYRRLGLDDDARLVLMAKQRRSLIGRHFAARLWGKVQDVVVGYGYRPMRAAVWLFLVLSIGSITFARIPPTPVNPDASPPFDPVIYTTDVLLPIVELGQETAFSPTGATRWLMYGLMAAGWILVTTVAAGVARSVRRD